MKQFAMIAAVACLAVGSGAAQAASSKAVGTCKQHSSAMLDALVTKQFNKTGDHLDANLSKKLTPDTMSQIWKLLTQKAGAYQSRGTPTGSSQKGTAVVTTPVNFKKMALKARVACDGAGKISGLRFVPAKGAGNAAK